MPSYEVVYIITENSIPIAVVIGRENYPRIQELWDNYTQNNIHFKRIHEMTLTDSFGLQKIAHMKDNKKSKINSYQLHLVVSEGVNKK